MKKSLSIALIFLLLAPAVILTAWREIDSGKEEINITEEILSGDPRAAEGITLEIASHWDRRLLWDTSYIVGGGEEAQTTFRFSTRQVSWDAELSKTAELSLYDDYGEKGWYAGFPETFEKVAEEVPAGSTYTEVIRMSDSITYYPLVMTIGGSSVSYEDSFDNGYFVSDFLTEFFHISTGEDQIELTLEKDEEGHLSYASIRKITEDPDDVRQDTIQLWGSYAFAENGFYYAYTCENLLGETVDRGQETGIFFFPYRMEGDVIHIELAQVRKICEQPEGRIPAQMLLDEEKGYLYLAAVGKEGYDLFVYAAEGENVTLIRQVPLIQKETTPEGETALPYFRRMTAEQGGLLVTWSDNSFVFVMGEGEACQKWCDGVFPRYIRELESEGVESGDGELTGYMAYMQEKERPFPLDNACAFDGERLVLAAFEKEDSLNVLLAVYDEKGERYSGLYQHSSDLDADTDQYGRKRIQSQVNRGWAVLGTRQKTVNSPLKITME